MVMLFGMMNFVVIFNRLVRIVLVEYIVFLDFFIDDIIIFSDCWESYIRYI